jgi:spectinomycin phosphotransferase
LTGMTEEQWKQVGTIFRHIHQVALPPGGFASLRKEAFDPEEYTRWVGAFETQLAHAQGQGAAQRTLRSCWLAHQSTVHMVVTTLEQLAGMLRSQTFPLRHLPRRSACQKSNP